MTGPRLNRQTFLDVAEAIKEVADGYDHLEDQFNAIRSTAESIADKFASRVSHFDRALFLKNCGVAS